MQFDADLVIRYLTEVLKIEDPEDFPDPHLKNDFFDMMHSPKDEWDLAVVEDNQILEIIILEQLLISRTESMQLREVMDEFYFPHFSTAFFDPEPRPNISIAGWLSYNYGQSYERETNHLPSLSLSPVVDIIKELVSASPTCDEMVTEYVTDIYLSHRDNDERELGWEFFNGEAADHIYNLSKVLRKVNTQLSRLALNSFEDDLPYSLGQLIIEELDEDFLQVFQADMEEDQYQHHPLLLVQNQIEDLKALYPN